jgi:hypothetical protein
MVMVLPSDAGSEGKSLLRIRQLGLEMRCPQVVALFAGFTF